MHCCSCSCSTESLSSARKTQRVPSASSTPSEKSMAVLCNQKELSTINPKNPDYWQLPPPDIQSGQWLSFVCRNTENPNTKMMMGETGWGTHFLPVLALKTWFNLRLEGIVALSEYTFCKVEDDVTNGYWVTDWRTEELATCNSKTKVGVTSIDLDTKRLTS